MIEQVSTSIEVRYLTPRAREWLREKRVARVLHVFERSCNLIDERGEILSLVTTDPDAGPFSMLVEPLTPAFDGWVLVDTPVSMAGHGLILGGVSIKPDEAATWEPRLDWEAHNQFLPDLIDWFPILQKVLALDAPENSLGRLPFLHQARTRSVKHSKTSFSESFLQAASSPAWTLCQGLVQGDLEAIQNGAAALAGLGPGLTPAGDDFILGAALATWLVYPFEVAEPLVAVMSAIAVPYTTVLSAAWIRAAARAEAGKRWHNLFDALATKDGTRFEECLRSLAAAGHTSGSDALAGFFSVLELFAESYRL